MGSYVKRWLERREPARRARHERRAIEEQRGAQRSVAVEGQEPETGDGVVMEENTDEDMVVSGNPLRTAMLAKKKAALAAVAAYDFGGTARVDPPDGRQRDERAYPLRAAQTDFVTAEVVMEHWTRARIGEKETKQVELMAREKNRKTHSAGRKKRRAENMDRPLAGPEVEGPGAEWAVESEAQADPAEVVVSNDAAAEIGDEIGSSTATRSVTIEPQTGDQDAGETEIETGQRHRTTKRKGKGSDLRRSKQRVPKRSTPPATLSFLPSTAAMVSSIADSGGHEGELHTRQVDTEGEEDDGEEEERPLEEVAGVEDEEAIMAVAAAGGMPRGVGVGEREMSVIPADRGQQTATLPGGAREAELRTTLVNSVATEDEEGCVATEGEDEADEVVRGGRPLEEGFEDENDMMGEDQARKWASGEAIWKETRISGDTARTPAGTTAAHGPPGEVTEAALRAVLLGSKIGVAERGVVDGGGQVGDVAEARVSEAALQAECLRCGSNRRVRQEAPIEQGLAVETGDVDLADMERNEDEEDCAAAVDVGTASAAGTMEATGKKRKRKKKKKRGASVGGRPIIIFK